MIKKYSPEVVRACLIYFMDRYKKSPTDDNGQDIKNGFAYFKKAMLGGLERVSGEKSKGGEDLEKHNW